MLIRDLRNYLRGAVEFELRARQPERLLNLAAMEQVELWNVRRREGVLRAWVHPADFPRLRAMRRRGGGRLRIRQKRGWPFFAARLERRKALLAGAVVFVLAISYLSTFIWFVEVRGARQISAAELLQAAAEMGLRRGVSKWYVRPEEIAANLELRYPQIGQVLVTITGTRAVLDVVENAPLPQRANNNPADLVARKEGVLHRLIVVMGRGEAREGEPVQPGQVLIRGVVKGESKANPDNNEEVPVRAQGEAWARVWYENYEEIPLKYREHVRTGRTFTRKVIKANGREIIIWGRGPIPFPLFEVEERPTPLFSWRNQSFRVESLSATYYEVEAEPRSRTMADALALAEARAARQAMQALGPAGQILSVRVWPVFQQDDRVGVRSRVETLEDIAVPSNP